VQEGQEISVGTPVAIVEVMKLMNQVLAESACTVRAVVVENGADVERDQPIVYVDPS